MIKDYRTPTRLAAWSGVGLCLLIALATLTNAQVNAREPGDILCIPTDIYGYTATTGDTMIAVQLTNESEQEHVVDVEFWDGVPGSGKRIGRGSLAIAPGMTGTEAIPWPVSNGAYDIHVRIDPENTIAELDESNNVVQVEIRYTNGRFSLNPVRDGRAGASMSRSEAGGRMGGRASSEQQALAEKLDRIQRLKARVVEFLDTDGPLPEVEPFQEVLAHIAEEPLVLGIKKEVQQLEEKIASLDKDAGEHQNELRKLQSEESFLRAALQQHEGEVRRGELAQLRAELVEQEAAVEAALQVAARSPGASEAGVSTPSVEDLDAQLRADCQNNLKQLGLVFKMYANESEGGVFPVLAQESGRLMYAWGGNNSTLDGLPVLSTEFASEGVKLTVCPATEGTADLPDDGDFVYLGYLLQSDADVRDFAIAYGNEASKGSEWPNGLFVNDLPSPNNDGTVIHRIREGIERFIITDINNPAGSALAQSQIPTMIEWPDHPIESGGQGGNVLYMDGHVEFLEYPGKWPMTEETISTLRILAGAQTQAHSPADGIGQNEPKNFMEGIVHAIGSAANDQLRADCQNQMKHLGLAFKMFSSDSGNNVFPALSDEGGTLMFGWGGDNRAHSNGALLSAEYIAGVEQVSRCPLSPLPASDTPGDQDYVYLGYLVKGDESVEAFAEAYRERVLLGGEGLFEEDLSFSKQPVYRLRQGIERIFFPNGSSPESDAWSQAQLPVLIEWPDRHETTSDRQGGNVLFMDGHVEFMVYPGKWPMTEETMGILAELAGRDPVELTHTGGMSVEELRKVASASNAVEATPPAPTGRRGGGMRLGRSVAATPAAAPTFDMGNLGPDAPCGTRLKYLGLALKVFANESPGGVWPPMSRDLANMMFLWGGESDTVDGQNVLSTGFSPTIPTTVVCRDSGRAISAPDDTDFVYLGYVMRDEGDLRRFAEAYEAWAAAGADKNAWFTDDKPASPDKGIIRIREGVERFLITDINNPAASAMAQSNIPVVIEWPDHHVDSGTMGGNVLFMDGHVEFMAYPGDFPMTEEAMEILCKLAGRDAIVVEGR